MNTNNVQCATYHYLGWRCIVDQCNVVSLQTILFCAIDETLDDQTGFYYEVRNPFDISVSAVSVIY